MTVVPAGAIGVGFQLPVQAQSSLFVAPWEAEAGPAELGLVAQAADRAGFLYAAVCDHVAIPDALADAMGTTWYDTVATMGWLAAQTSHIHLLSHVFVAAYRHPLVAAKSFATIDRLSSGRLVIGIGAGHVEAEFERLDVDFATRGAATDVAVDQLAAALAGDVEGFTIAPRPVQAPRPPIWIGGSSPAAQRRAAERGDGWLPQGAATPDAVARIRQLRDACGRGGDPIELGTILGPVHLGEPSWDLPGPTLTGSADKLVHVIRKVAGDDVSHVQVSFRSRSCSELCDQLHAFGAEVLVHLGA